MPLYALVGHDRPGQEARLQHRPAHLEHMARLDAAGRLIYGGPIMNEHNQMVGSLIILEADSLEAARATYAEDPYVVHQVFASYDVIETRQVFPRGN